MAKHLDIEVRMRRYEDSSRIYLTPRMPVIIRVDGNAFHTLTKKMYSTKGYKEEFSKVMQQVTAHLMGSGIQGAVLAYCQSDEISILLVDYEQLNTEAWFDYNINKLNSITAARAASKFTQLTGKLCAFDARAFNIPREDVVNYFISRQMDATRNAIQLAACENFSHNYMQNKNCNQLQAILFLERGINFNNYPAYRKRGFVYTNRFNLDLDIPVFTQDRNYIERFVYGSIEDQAQNLV